MHSVLHPEYLSRLRRVNFLDFRFAFCFLLAELSIESTYVLFGDMTCRDFSKRRRDETRLKAIKATEAGPDS